MGSSCSTGRSNEREHESTHDHHHQFGAARLSVREVSGHMAARSRSRFPVLRPPTPSQSFPGPARCWCGAAGPRTDLTARRVPGRASAVPRRASHSKLAIRPSLAPKTNRGQACTSTWHIILDLDITQCVITLRIATPPDGTTEASCRK